MNLTTTLSTIKSNAGIDSTDTQYDTRLTSAINQEKGRLSQGPILPGATRLMGSMPTRHTGRCPRLTLPARSCCGECLIMSTYGWLRERKMNLSTLISTIKSKPVRS